jgi:hypothetical protein
VTTISGTRSATLLRDSMLNCFVSSMMVTTEQTEVSLNMAMKSLTTGGMTMRNACGTMIRRSACTLLMPSDNAASIWPPGIACRPAR